MAIVDPNVLAYLTSLHQLQQQKDLQEAQINAQEQALAADRARQEGIVNANTTQQLSTLNTAGENSRTGISGGLENRGLYGSGEMETDLAKQRATQAQQQGTVQSGAANSISGIEANIAQQQNALEQQRAQARLSFQQKGLQT